MLSTRNHLYVRTDDFGLFSAELQICNYLFPVVVQIADVAISCALFAAERILLRKQKQKAEGERTKPEIANLQFPFLNRL